MNAWFRSQCSRPQVGAIALVALAARAYVAFGTGLSWYNTDTSTYYEQADSILSGDPFALFPNGYPLLIAGLKLVAPESLVPELNIALNVVLGTLTALLVYGIAKTLGGQTAGTIAVVVAAVYPNQLNYTRQLLSEVPSTFLLMLALALFVLRKPIGAGLATVAASTVRTNLAPVGPLLTAIDLGSKRPRQQAFRYLLGVLAALALYGSLIATDTIARSSNLGMNLLIAIQSQSRQEIVFELDAYTQAQRSRPIATYLSFAAQNPGEFLRQRASSLRALWGPWPSRGSEQNPRSVLDRLLIGLRFPMLVLAAIAVGMNRRQKAVWAVATPIITITVVHTLFYATPRYVFPAEPAAIALASLAIAPLINRWRQQPPAPTPRQ